MKRGIEKLIAERGETDPYKYMLLDRMKQDCEYFLDGGMGNEACLWGKTVEEHIQDMKALFNSFSDENKPEWLSMEQIEDYEKRMMEKRSDR